MLGSTQNPSPYLYRHSFWSKRRLEVVNCIGNYLIDYAYAVYIYATGFCSGLLGMKVRSTWQVMAQKWQSFLSGNGCQWKKLLVMYVVSSPSLHWGGSLQVSLVLSLRTSSSISKAAWFEIQKDVTFLASSVSVELRFQARLMWCLHFSNFLVVMQPVC